jgi:hypothetical protein
LRVSGMVMRCFPPAINMTRVRQGPGGASTTYLEGVAG